MAIFFSTRPVPFVVSVLKRFLKWRETLPMQMHIQRHHPEINLSGAKKPQQQQSTLTNLFQTKLPIYSDRAQKITRAIGLFMALDMR